MQVILQENLDNLGKVGDIVKVKPGYARNFLIPNGLAAVASERNISQLGHQKRAAEARRDKIKTAAAAIQKAVEAVKVVIARQVGEGDKLFGSVTSMDIESVLRSQGLSITKKQIVLAEPIKTLGVHDVSVKVHPEVTAVIKVTVTRAEKAE